MKKKKLFGVILFSMLGIAGIVFLVVQKKYGENFFLQKIFPIRSCGVFEDGVVKETVFVGDSLTALGKWDTFSDFSCVKNAGVSGNITQDVLLRLDSAISGKPKTVFLMIGVNDLLRGRDIPSVLRDYREIVETIQARSPQTTIFVQSVLPTNNSLSTIGKIEIEKIIELNKGIREFADEKQVFYLSLYPVFSDEHGVLRKAYTVDGVHLTPEGYAVWRDALNVYRKYRF